jgi:hypothetical protein
MQLVMNGYKPSADLAGMPDWLSHPIDPAGQAYREEVGEPRQHRNRQAAPEPVVHSITGAVAPHSSDLDVRVRRYLWSMAVRTVCVVLVIVIDNPIRWVFAVLAVVLPGVAVVVANLAGNKVRRAVPVVTPTGVTQISLPRGEQPITTPGAPNAPYEQRNEGSAERTP